MTDEPTNAADPGTVEPTPTPVSTPTPIPTPAKPVPDDTKGSKAANPFVWGTGRRKTAVARVRIRSGEGSFMVNKRKLNDYFKLDKDRQAVRTPLQVTETSKSVDVFVNVSGGGISGQAGAVVLGLARALAKADVDHEPTLRQHNLLTRDPRKVERKKYGQRGARRRFQFSKR